MIAILTNLDQNALFLKMSTNTIYQNSLSYLSWIHIK